MGVFVNGFGHSFTAEKRKENEVSEENEARYMAKMREQVLADGVGIR